MALTPFIHLPFYTLVESIIKIKQINSYQHIDMAVQLQNCHKPVSVVLNQPYIPETLGTGNITVML